MIQLSFNLEELFCKLRYETCQKISFFREAGAIFWGVLFHLQIYNPRVSGGEKITRDKENKERRKNKLPILGQGFWSQIGRFLRRIMDYLTKKRDNMRAKDRHKMVSCFFAVP